MFIGSERQRQQGLHHIEVIKKTHFSTSECPMKRVFDHASPQWKLTLCFHAGLKARHTRMTFDELSAQEQRQLIDATLSMTQFARRLNTIFR